MPLPPSRARSCPGNGVKQAVVKKAVRSTSRTGMVHCQDSTDRPMLLSRQGSGMWNILIYKLEDS